MTAVDVRPAVTADAPRLLAMYDWLFEPPGYRPGAWDLDRARSALSDAIERDRSSVLVAEAPGGALVGLISAYLDIDSVRFGQRCWVEDLVVAPTHRSAGVGRALLVAAKAWARERGATHLELDTGLARHDAQRFYDREEPATKGFSYSWRL